jgi:hypothetical protein
MRRAQDEFLTELEHLEYSRNAVETYSKTIERFIRWAEGSWTPGGPRK